MYVSDRQFRGSYKQTEKRCRVHADRNDVAATKSSWTGNTYVVKEPRAAKLYVCKDFHHYVFNPTESKKGLRSVSKLEPIDLPPFSLFIAHFYQHFAGADDFANHNPRYDMYLIPGTIPTLDATCCSYSNSVAILAEVLVAGLEHEKEKKLLKVLWFGFNDVPTAL